MTKKTDSKQSKGGIARKEALTPEQRKEIARKAAQARWNDTSPTAMYDGVFYIGDREVSAVVLDDGSRLLTQATFLQVLGRSRSPKAGTGVLSNVDELPFFLQADVLIPFINNDLLESTKPVFFQYNNGKKGVGYRAEALPKVAEVYLQYRDSCREKNKHPVKTLSHIIIACDLVTRALAQVGIVALIDEATGYQEVRDRKALQAILDKFLTDEWAKWSKTFSDEFYKQLFRLKGIKYPPMDGGKKPSYVGHWTNDIVYSRLAPGVLKELKSLNPRNPETGARKRKHHQHLTKDYGHPVLTEYISNVTFLMAGCLDWNDFKRRLDQAKPKYGNTLEIPFD